MNDACKHGFTARTFPCILEKGSVEWQEFIDLRVPLHDHFQPPGPVEEFLVEKILLELVRYRRLLVREQRPNVLAIE